MPIQIIRNDITKIACDAIVNAANQTLLGGGGVDGAIHKAAGKGLLLECMKLGGCKTGQAKITGAHKLPCRYVIHTVGPKWQGGNRGEQALLESCYRQSLRLAAENNCQSVAFPLISSGAYGYPKDRALKAAVDIISGFLLEHDMLVYIVVFDKSAYQISEKLFSDIAAYIDDKYVDAHFAYQYPQAAESSQPLSDNTILAETQVFSAEDFYERIQGVDPSACFDVEPQSTATQLDNLIKQVDESFSQMLLRKIDEKGMTDAACYKRANVDRKLFSKIRSDVHYKTSKTTAIAFAIALELSLEETKDLLMKAGFALSHSNKFDIIVEYFIEHKNYNIHEINEALFEFDQSLLGV